MIDETIPVYKFWTSNFPNLDPEFNGRPIPEFYGEKENIVPACIDTTIMKYQIAYREINAIDTVEADGITLELDENYEVDLTQAQFTIYGMPYCQANTDYYLVLQGGTYTINGVDYVELAGDDTAGYTSGGGQYYKIDGDDNWVGDAGKDLCFLIYGKKSLDGDEELVTGLDKSHYDTDYPLRDHGERSKLAQGFRMPGDSYYITRVIVWIKKIGDPIDYFRISVYEDDQETRVGGFTERKDVSNFNTAITLLQNNYYQFTSDSDVRVDGKGYEDNFGNLINTHAGMLEHLWTTVMGRSNALLDSTSFADLEAEHPEPVCEYFNYEVSFSTIVTNLEAGALFKFLPGLDGVWRVPFYEAGVPSGTTHLRDEDFLNFRVLRDAHSIHYKVQIQYNKDPSDQKYKTREATSDIARYLYKRKTTLYLETYLKDGSDADVLASIYQGLIEVPQRKAIYEVSGYGFDALPTEKVLITRERADSITGAFDAEIFRQLSLTKRISTGTVNVEALLDELSY